TAAAALQRLPPPSAFRAAGFAAAIADRLEPEAAEGWLEDAGYALLPLANEPGEAAVRQDRIDVFPPDAARPLRLDLADGRLAALRRYDPFSQLGDEDPAAETGLLLPPAGELLLTDDARRRFLGGYLQAFGEAAAEDTLYRCVAEGNRVDGLEHWLPLAHDGALPTVFDLLPDAALTCDGAVTDHAADRLEEIAEAYDSRREQGTHGGGGEDDSGLGLYRPVPPERLYLTADEWRAAAGRLAVVAAAAAGEDGDAAAIPAFGDVAAALAWLRQRRQAGQRVTVLAASGGERARVRRLLSRAGLAPRDCPDWAAAGEADVAVVPAAVPRGFVLADRVVVAARQIDPALPAARAAQAARSVRQLASDLTDLVLGDLVVHVDHGIGRCDDLLTVEADGLPRDVVQVTFRDDEKVLVPAEHADLLWRYGSGEAEVALDAIGGSRWPKRLDKGRVDLRRLAGGGGGGQGPRRGAREAGAPLLRPPPSYARFAARFPHVETPDQQRAIDAVLADLAAGMPMDRLVCGDVGFGKTEVALRAAFVAAAGGVQVAVVAPTTPLCRQHYDDFRRRLRPFGLRVGLLARSQSRSEAEAVKAALKRGDIDVVIGTHGLLNAGFDRLGLLIVDEEHRFGTRQKEQLAEARPQLHMLRMTATPIPRTLQSALAGLRPVSVLATPPVECGAVRTVVQAFDGPVVRQAILRERRRGGQCFYVCPRIEDLEPARERLAELLPDLRLAVAHARLRPADLDDIMMGFAAGRSDLLLSTNIIEAGLNIPNANTLFVQDADLFGLAQLHQLRGRVGRSGRAAHAYFLHDGGEALGEGARERLEALRAFSDPGAGLRLAARDRDLRGGGVLLGDRQAGHADDVGAELLEDLLRQELLRARGTGLGARLLDAAAGDDPMAPPHISLGTAVTIPADYIADADLRLSVHRRIAAAEDPEALESELVDRFGPLPPEVEDLLALAAVKHAARAAGVAEIACGPRGAVLGFHGRPPRVRGLRRRDDGRLVATGDWPDPRDRAAAVLAVLEHLPRRAYETSAAAPASV
ncbi:DEAD/DEAH box helicase, partial [Caenispirillum bisanense]|uniref:DEAD/DEAH box helicase n=1 Tax=Caenispirillum bisanense TaxID=414052 RepID=UPI0031CDCB43